MAKNQDNIIKSLNSLLLQRSGARDGLATGMDNKTVSGGMGGAATGRDSVYFSGGMRQNLFHL